MVSRGFSAWRRLAMVLVACCGVALVAGARGAAADAPAPKLRFGGDASATRVVIDVDRSIEGRLIAGGPSQALVVEFPRLSGQPTTGLGQGLVGRWKLERAGSGSKLTLNLNRDGAVDRRFLLAPGEGISHYRYVIDLKAAGGPAPDPIAAVAAAKAPAPAPPPKANPAPLRRTIVIDAGHGGRDPGALGAHGAEKEITLAAARALKTRLEKGGRYRVVLTREGDSYIELEERVQIARRANADLFISLHADAGERPTTRGASVYTLSDQGSDRVARNAISSNNWQIDASRGAVDRAVTNILFDLTQRATRNKSAAFADILIRRVGAEQPLLTRAHRDAGYVVLFAPDVPAVLLEMGFITNPEDEANLRSVQHRERLVDAIAKAIDDYFAESVTTAAL